MSYYRVLIDGRDIYDHADRSHVLLSPTLTLDLTSAGSLEFKRPKTAADVEIVPYKSTVEVLEDGHNIFYGRALPPAVDLYGRRSYHCEGMLAALNDVPLPAAEYPGTDGEDPKDTSTYVSEILAYYNSKKPPEQQISAVVLPTSGTNLRQRSWDNKTALEAIKAEAQEIGAVMFCRRNGLRLALLDDYMANLPPEQQAIRLDSNLIDLTLKHLEVTTAVYAKGEDKDGNPVTATVTDAELEARYGYICKFQEFTGCKSAEELAAEARGWLRNNRVSEMVIEASAYDLNLLDRELPRFEIGRKAVIDDQRLLSLLGIGGSSLELPISGITVDLSTGRKTVKLGYGGRDRRMSPISRKVNAASAQQEPGDIAGEIERLDERIDGIAGLSADGWQHWFGTMDEFRRIGSRDPRTIYYIKSNDVIENYMQGEILTGNYSTSSYSNPMK